MFKQNRILVVDADPSTPRQLAQLFGSRFQFCAAESLQARPPHDPIDLVLADYKVAAGDARVPSVPLIAIIPRNSIQSAILAIKHGANDCVQRPFDTGELLNAVEAQLNGMTSPPTQSPAQVAPSNGHSVDIQPDDDPAGRVQLPPDMSLAELQDICIRQALKHHGTTSRAAAVLGISARTLQRKRRAWRLAEECQHDQQLPPRDNQSSRRLHSS